MFWPGYLACIAFTDEAASCTVVACSRCLESIGTARDKSNLHSGFASSHFFFRRLHVPQPVLVRLANCCFYVRWVMKRCHRTYPLPLLQLHLYPSPGQLGCICVFESSRVTRTTHGGMRHGRCTTVNRLGWGRVTMLQSLVVALRHFARLCGPPSLRLGPIQRRKGSLLGTSHTRGSGLVHGVEQARLMIWSCR